MDCARCLPLDFLLTPLYPLRGVLPRPSTRWLQGAPQRWAVRSYPAPDWGVPPALGLRLPRHVVDRLAGWQQLGARAWRQLLPLLREGWAGYQRQRLRQLRRIRAAHECDRDRRRQILLHPRVGDLRVRGASRFRPTPQLIRRLCGLPSGPYLPAAPL